MNVKVSRAQRSQEKARARANAISAQRSRWLALAASVRIARAISSGRSGSKYSPPSPRISGIGPRFAQAIGKPAAIASSSALGMFSQLDANTNRSDSLLSVWSASYAIGPR